MKTAQIILACLILGGCSSRGGSIDSYEFEMTVPNTKVEVQTPDKTPITVENASSASIILSETGEIQEVKAPSGTIVKIKKNVVTQPENPETAATLNTKEGTDASTGFAQQVSQAIGQLGFLPWIGVLLMIIGTLGFVASFKYGVIPKAAGPSLAGLGGLLIFLPTFIEGYSWLLAIFVVIGLLVIVFIVLRKLGIIDKMAGQNVAGLEALKEKYPDLEKEINGVMREMQDEDVQKEVVRMKQKLRRKK